MAIFSRRVLKRCLDEILAADIASPTKVNDWVQRLDDISDAYAATEWEIVLINLLSKRGTVEHEKGETVDVIFSSQDGSVSFAADITVISDQPLHRNNPIEALWDELTRRVRHVRSGGFGFQVAEKRQATHLGSGNKRSLLIPRVPEFGKLIFNERFTAFLRAVKELPTQGCTYHAVAPGVSVLITYFPGRMGVFQGAYGSYTDATVIDDNPLFNGLERKVKRKQLKRCSFAGPKGIIICDGGCRMLDEPLSHHSTYSVQQVVNEFFRRHGSIAFVVVIAIKSELPSLGGGSYSYRHRLFVHPQHHLPERELREVLAEVVRTLPSLQMTPENAVRRAKFEKSKGRPVVYRGGWQMSGNKIRVSGRALLELMAGKLDQNQFVKEHTVGVGGRNFFDARLKSGELIVKASVERQPDEDDDWIVFEFGEPDAALAQFGKLDSSANK